MIWSHISALGGLAVTLVVALAIAAWLVGARCWRLALAWWLLFGAALAVAVASQAAFIGWGVGIRWLDFTGFSGHATRAAAVFPVAGFLLFERDRPWRRALGIAAGTMLAALVALARVKVGAHSPAEAAFGCALGLGAALLFVVRARANRRASRRPVLVGGIALALLVLPRGEPLDTHQWVTALALAAAQQERPYERWSWARSPQPYQPPCAHEKVRLGYFCT